MSHSNGHTKTCSCPECEIIQMARNNYFTGKLLVERDFTDEQHYFRGKDQRHNQYLHGSGVVCGLKVVQHPNDKCQDKYVIIEPGTAIDCCGHEIMVRDELRGVLQDRAGKPLNGVIFNFADSPEVQALEKANDSQPHTLQICLRYKECGTEEIPVLYDECGCDETKCAPNRILEGSELGVLLDQEIQAHGPHSAKLERKGTIPYAHSFQVALHNGTRRLFVMTVDPSGTAIYAIDTDDGSNTDSVSTTDTGLALAVSADGKELYLAVKTTAGTEIRVLDAASLKATPVPTLTLGAAVGDPTVLAPTAGGSLLALFGSSGNLAIWDSPITPGATPTVITLSPDLEGLVFSTDGARAYVADKTNSQIRVIDVTGKTHNSADDIVVTDPTPTNPAPAPSTVAVAHSTAGDALLVGDQTNRLFYMPQDGSKIVKIAALSNPPLALMASPGGNWIYVLEKDVAGNFLVEPISTHRLLMDKDARGESVAVGANSKALALSDSGETLYIPFDEEKGGVAILDVSEEDCGDLLWQSLDGCPACDSADCIVLATIENYHVSDKLKDQTDPPADATQDDIDNVARIDNRSGRHLLPSTQVLTKVVECLLEHGGGGGGKQGLPGPTGAKGANGPGIDDVDAKPLPSGSLPTATIDAVGVTPRKLHLGIPKGDVGPPGPSAIVAAGRFDLAGNPLSAFNKGITLVTPVSGGPPGVFDVDFTAFSGDFGNYVIKGIVIIGRNQDTVRVLHAVEPPNTLKGITVQVIPGFEFDGFMIEITDLTMLP